MASPLLRDFGPGFSEPDSQGLPAALLAAPGRSFPAAPCAEMASAPAEAPLAFFPFFPPAAALRRQAPAAAAVEKRPAPALVWVPAPQLLARLYLQTAAVVRKSPSLRLTPAVPASARDRLIRRAARAPDHPLSFLNSACACSVFRTGCRSSIARAWSPCFAASAAWRRRSPQPDDSSASSCRPSEDPNTRRSCSGENECSIQLPPPFLSNR